MPSPDVILVWASAVANDWRSFAIVWHVALAALCVALLIGWRPSARLLGGLLTLPFVSVSALAWASGNPFNGLAFAILVAALARGSTRLTTSSVERASSVSFAAGILLMVLGATYPHFLRTDAWATYLYAAPLGLLPCPTLSAVIGVTLMFGALRSIAWTGPLLLAGLLYGVIGVFSLRVTLDAGLLVGAALLALSAGIQLAGRSVRADADERTRPLPGDRLISDALGTLTHGITIGASPSAVWPWVIQMGAGRAGWYSYDLLDNGRQASATRIIPELQHPAVGAVFPALPGATDGFLLLACDPPRSLILGWPNPDGSLQVTWAFAVEERPGNSTRLIVRARGARGYQFHGLPAWLSMPLVRLVHFAMQRKQLLGIARRVESSSAALPNAA